MIYFVQISFCSSRRWNSPEQSWMEQRGAHMHANTSFPMQAWLHASMCMGGGVGGGVLQDGEKGWQHQQKRPAAFCTWISSHSQVCTGEPVGAFQSKGKPRGDKLICFTQTKWPGFSRTRWQMPPSPPHDNSSCTRWDFDKEIARKRDSDGVSLGKEVTLGLKLCGSICSVQSVDYNYVIKYMDETYDERWALNDLLWAFQWRLCRFVPSAWWWSACLRAQKRI